MALYRFHVQKISGYFEGCEFFHIPRAENDAADELSKLGSAKLAIPPGIALEHLRVPSIKPSPESESIFIPTLVKHQPEPMDVDGGDTSSNPGTVQSDPGTSQPNPGTANDTSAEALQVESMEVDPEPKDAEAQPMEVDEPIFPVRTIPSWAQPIMAYLAEGKLPEDEAEAR